MQKCKLFRKQILNSVFLMIFTINTDLEKVRFFAIIKKISKSSSSIIT